MTLEDLYALSNVDNLLKCGSFMLILPKDPTGLTAALQATDLAGVLHMLYCVLFHGTISDPSTTSPKESYTQNTIQVAIQSLRFFNSFALLDLSAFQVQNLGSGAEGLSLAFRHMASSLLGHCSQVSCESLLHEVIICVGYFTVNHPDNQVIVQSGRHPTVLQKLCQLPFQYFSDPRLIKVLFPSLIAASYNNLQNKIILEQEMSCVLLATFIQDFAQTPGPVDNQSSYPKGNLLDVQVAVGSQDLTTDGQLQQFQHSDRLPHDYTKLFWEGSAKLPIVTSALLVLLNARF
ncbi:hypothetical protein STEG23_005892 [Scotinomys teguina]